MKTINQLLVKLSACGDAKEWAKNKTWEEIFNTCPRGDWLLWLFKRTMTDNEENLRKLTLAKGHCANTVRHLMKDERRIDDGLGNAALADLTKARIAAAPAADAYAADAADAAARKKNQMETANACRQHLPIEIWNITFDN